MTDDVAQPGRSNRSEKKSEARQDPDLARDLADSSRALGDAIEKHQAWGSAILANDGLSDQVGRVLAAMQPIRIPDIDRTLDAMAQQVLANSGAAERMAEVAARVSSKWADDLKALAPAFDKLQGDLRALNYPSFATRTQTFLTQTDALQYRGRRRVWHYTGAAPMLNILANHVLWASSPHNLNDTSEVLHGVEVISAAVDRAANGGLRGDELATLRSVVDDDFILEAMHDVFYISASSEPDSLTLWRNYSTSDGFAIGISPTTTLSADGAMLNPEVQRPDLPQIANWFRVHYSTREKISLADEFLATALADIRAAPPARRPNVVRELRKHLLVLASTMKHSAFKDEREVRWITTNWAPVGLLHYELTGRGIVPVLHVATAASDEERAHLPIRGVRCSPTTSTGIVRTIEGLLVQRGYDAAAKDVVRSELPFRG